MIGVSTREKVNREGGDKMILNELIQSLPDYKIEVITKENIEDVMELMKSNVYFYSKTQKHEVNLQEYLEDISLLPPGRKLIHKTYVSFYKQGQCVAILDFVEGYPKEEIGYIGMMMVHEAMHGKGIASQILSKVYEISTHKKFKFVELACYETNEKGLAFWKKQGFKEVRRCKRETDGEEYVLISMQRACL